MTAGRDLLDGGKRWTVWFAGPAVSDTDRRATTSGAAATVPFRAHATGCRLTENAVSARLP